MAKKKLKALIVEEDKGTIDSYKEAYSDLPKNKGISIKYASNYKDALKIAKDFHPHLAFIDYHLFSEDKKDGAHLIWQLKSMSGMYPLFYIVSSISEKEIKEECKDRHKNLYDHINETVRGYIRKDDGEDFIKEIKEIFLRVPKILFIDEEIAQGRHEREAEDLLGECNAVFEFENKLKEDDLFEVIDSFHPHILFLRYSFFRRMTSKTIDSDTEESQEEFFNRISDLDYSDYRDESNLPRFYFIGSEGQHARTPNTVEQELNKGTILNGFINIHSEIKAVEKKVKDEISRLLK